MAQTHYKQQINAFAQSLRQEERAQGTIENYLRHLRASLPRDMRQGLSTLCLYR